jgi:PAT family beta-lactamase induction signal transducer AmpG
LIHASGNLAFIFQAYAGHDVRVLGLTIFVENFTGGLVSAAFVGYLSTLCHPAFTATQFALFTSLTAVGRTLFASGAGWLAEQLGWPLFFAASAVAALPGIALAIALTGDGGGLQLLRRSSPNAPKLPSSS